VLSLASDGAYVYSGAHRGATWRRPLSEIAPTSVEEAPDPPAAFELAQNFPNPFNPLTTIRYSLPSKSHVILTVYNLLGQKAAELVNGEQDVGRYEVTFNGSGFAAGVYFYRLRAGEFSQARRLLLLR
jgi:Secretion system C-terminal sorting domain